LFDVARAIAIVWALVVVFRARARVDAIVILAVAYLFALEVASGFTVRREGVQEPMMALVLALVGPSAIPRGALPGLLGASLVVRWPATVNVAACAVLIARDRILSARIDTLPAFSNETRNLDRVGRVLVLIAAFEGIGAGTRALPFVLDWGAEGSVFDERAR
jgi:hypothetical protein